MKLSHFVLAAASAATLATMTGCTSAGVPTMERMSAGLSGCDPRDPSLQPFTQRFEMCKGNFPKLAQDYKSKEDRIIQSKGSVLNGDVQQEMKGEAFSRLPRAPF